MGCTVDNCGKPICSRSMCRSHYNMEWRRKNYEKVEAMNAARRLNTVHKVPVVPTNPVSYVTAHERISYYRGRAYTYLCVDCGEKARHWSFNHINPSQTMQENVRQRHRSGKHSKMTEYYCLLTYSSNPMDYDPRCIPCHRKFDKVEADV